MKRGDKIIVVRHDVSGHAYFFIGFVAHISGGRITYHNASVRLRDENGRVVGADTCASTDRGIVWARGWEGPEVDALKAVVAL